MYPAMTRSEISSLDGRIVLVRSASDQHDPPTALRGTLRVENRSAELPPKVSILVGMPDMFTAPAHTRTIELGEDDLARLLTSEGDGTYTCTLDYDFEQDTRDQTAVSPEARGGNRGRAQ
jgi:hypothetical protein